MKLIATFEIEGFGDHDVDPEDILTEFISEGHIGTHHNFYTDDGEVRAHGRLVGVRMDDEVTCAHQWAGSGGGDGYICQLCQKIIDLRDKSDTAERIKHIR